MRDRLIQCPSARVYRCSKEYERSWTRRQEAFGRRSPVHPHSPRLTKGRNTAREIVDSYVAPSQGLETREDDRAVRHRTLVQGSSPPARPVSCITTCRHNRTPSTSRSTLRISTRRWIVLQPTFPFVGKGWHALRSFRPTEDHNPDFTSTLSCHCIRYSPTPGSVRYPPWGTIKPLLCVRQSDHSLHIRNQSRRLVYQQCKQLPRP